MENFKTVSGAIGQSRTRPNRWGSRLIAFVLVVGCFGGAAASYLLLDFADSHVRAADAAADLHDNLGFLIGVATDLSNAHPVTPQLGATADGVEGAVRAELADVARRGFESEDLHPVAPEVVAYLTLFDQIRDLAVAGQGVEANKLTDSLYAAFKPMTPDLVRLVGELRGSAERTARLVRYLVMALGVGFTVTVGLAVSWVGRRQRRWAQTAAEADSRARFEAIVAHGSDLLVVTDPAGAPSYVSPSLDPLLGYEPTALGADGLAALVHPDDLAALGALAEQAAAGRAGPIDVRVRHADQTWRTMDLTVTDLAKVPEVRGLLWSARDVTDGRRLEAELRHAQKLQSIGQLAAGIAHEINTPIQFVGDNVRFLADAFDELISLTAPAAGPGGVGSGSDAGFLAAEVPEAIAQTLEGTERVAAIVRAMRSFGHPGTDEKSSADLNDAVRNTLVVAANEVKYVAELVTELGEIPPLWCHRGDVHQVLLNLVVNAAHAVADKVGDSGQRGTIWVRTRVEGDDAAIEVTDSGVGIPAEVAGRIFEPFFTTKAVGRGTGQGLALVHSLVVDRHGGSVGFASEQGVGTTFTVRLPLDGQSRPAGADRRTNPERVR